jgi:protein TonB
VTLGLARVSDDELFRKRLGISLGLHALIFLIANFGGFSSFRIDRPVMEIDLSIPLGTGGRKKGPVYNEPAKPLAPKAAPLNQKPVKAPPKPAPKIAPAKTVPTPKPEPETPPTPVALPPEPAVPAKVTAPQPLAVPPDAVETPGALAPGGPDGALHGTGSAPLSGGGRGHGEGTGDGTGTGQPLDLLPRLLNKEELLRNLRKFYPEKEWRAGKEGSVILKLEINEEGRTEPVEVMGSAGKAFDDAAQKVARTMKFAPAMRRGRPVAVRLPQRFVFELR